MIADVATQPALFATAQLQSLLESLTTMVPVPPDAEKDLLIGDSEMLHPVPGWNEISPTQGPHDVEALHNPQKSPAPFASGAALKSCSAFVSHSHQPRESRVTRG